MCPAHQPLSAYGLSGCVQDVPGSRYHLPYRVTVTPCYPFPHLHVVDEGMDTRSHGTTVQKGYRYSGTLCIHGWTLRVTSRDTQYWMWVSTSSSTELVHSVYTSSVGHSIITSDRTYRIGLEGDVESVLRHRITVVLRTLVIRVPGVQLDMD